MKNSNYFPFERNNYFYGKLLSVDDFELEQRYMNDKRRMINRFVNGSGVVAGLRVVEIDEQKISVERGIAIDSLGREIVIDTPIIKNLSLMEGYEASVQDAHGYVYLGLEYDEQETDMVHNIAGRITPSAEHGDQAFNRIREGYRLFVTSREPEQAILSPEDLYQETSVVYHGEDVKISHVLPRYVQAGRPAELVVLVENLGRRNLSFSYDLVLTRMVSDGQARVHVSFDEMLFERTGSYELRYIIETSDIPGVDAAAAVDPETVRFSLAGILQETEINGKISCEIVSCDEKNALVDAYYRTAMDMFSSDGYQQPIYLAKIFFVHAADAVIIEKVENVPFRQYVYNNTLETAVRQMLQNTVGLGAAPGKSYSGREKNNPNDAFASTRLSQGTAIITLKGDGGVRGERYYSNEIMHGLGLGQVTILLGLEHSDESVIFGSSEVFEQSDTPGVDAELASRQFPSNGSFVIGLRLTANTDQTQVKVHWTALRNMEDAVIEKSDRRIFIKPNLLELNVRQSYYLEAVCENMVEKAVTWSVRENGGTIDENGMYTAPSAPGVYEVMVQSVVFPEVRASIFVIVREM